MVIVAETMRALRALALLARFDRAGGAALGGDILTCRRSFWAYALGLPGFLLVQGVIIGDARHAPDDPVLAMVAALIGYVVQATLFPLLLLPLTALWRREARWPGFITGYNWLGLVNTYVFALILSLQIGTLGALGEILNLVWFVYAVVLEAFMAATLLEIGPVTAIAVVLLDVLVTFGVTWLADFIGGQR
jgi:hypothetical protein